MTRQSGTGMVGSGAEDGSSVPAAGSVASATDSAAGSPAVSPLRRDGKETSTPSAPLGDASS